ncbi:uncharacterized protein An05g02630 [Aspergillus niger]|uniref:Contig An05c0060, genomic contig n=2 Tax=Aspergillus niger TaxID=5061 RepID=A2QL58_ASPNC|nr:uncharacterized protein An05g02630 [Aspergillus niger]CAK44924.1 unnamed protein product [Aspergillus niger]
MESALFLSTARLWQCLAIGNRLGSQGGVLWVTGSPSFQGFDFFQLLRCSGLLNKPFIS